MRNTTHVSWQAPEVAAPRQAVDKRRQQRRDCAGGDDATGDPVTGRQRAQQDCGPRRRTRVVKLQGKFGVGETGWWGRRAQLVDCRDVRVWDMGWSRRVRRRAAAHVAAPASHHKSLHNKGQPRRRAWRQPPARPAQPADAPSLRLPRGACLALHPSLAPRVSLVKRPLPLWSSERQVGTHACAHRWHSQQSCQDLCQRPWGPRSGTYLGHCKRGSGAGGGAETAGGAAPAVAAGRGGCSAAAVPASAAYGRLSDAAAVAMKVTGRGPCGDTGRGPCGGVPPSSRPCQAIRGPLHLQHHPACLPAKPPSQARARPRPGGARLQQCWAVYVFRSTTRGDERADQTQHRSATEREVTTG